MFSFRKATTEPSIDRIYKLYLIMKLMFNEHIYRFPIGIQTTVQLETFVMAKNI